MGDGQTTDLLTPTAVRSATGHGFNDAIRQVGAVLVPSHQGPFVRGRAELERSISTFIGENVAIPTHVGP
jgi:mannitol/fructose-specific phosphotransferase system IIA component